MPIDLDAFIAFVVATTFTPGPNNLTSASLAVVVGYRRALPYMLGIFWGFALVMVFCATIASVVLTRLPGIEPFLRAAGAAYIMWLALRTWFLPYEVRDDETPPLGLLNGVTLQFLNFKMIAYGLAIYSTFLAPLAGQTTLISLSALGLAAVAFTSVSTWAVAGSLIRSHLRRPRIRRSINGALALMLVYSAVMLLHGGR